MFVFRKFCVLTKLINPCCRIQINIARKLLAFVTLFGTLPDRDHLFIMYAKSSEKVTGFLKIRGIFLVEKWKQFFG